MAIKYPENFVTTAWQRKPAAGIAAELAVASASRSNPKLLEIEHHLARAHELYFSRQYPAAIDEYKLTQGLIYRMLNKSFKVDMVRRPEIKLPLHPALFDPLLDAGMELVETTPIPSIPFDVGPAFLETPETVLDPSIAYEAVGVKIQDELTDTVRHDSAVAAAYAEMGQWDRAGFYYQKALGGLAGTEAYRARAALQLNLAGVSIQSGKTETAMGLLREAAAGFEKANDTIGLAQVNFNQAAAYMREGLQERADAHIQQGEQLLTQAQGLPQGGRIPEEPLGVCPGTMLGRPVIGISALERSVLEIPALEPPVGRPMLRPMGRPGFVSALETTAVEPLIARAETLSAPAYSTDPGILRGLADARGLAVTYRQPGKGIGWTYQPVETVAEAAEKTFRKSLGVLMGGKVIQVAWDARSRTPSEAIRAEVYDARIGRKLLSEVNWFSYLSTDFAVQLPHLYYYVIPVTLGDCYHALGEYEAAEAEYLKAANYQYINESVEVPALWRKLAANVLSWGDWLYKSEEYPDALEVYRKVLELPGSSPVVRVDAPLYAHAKLKLVGDTVRAMLEGYTERGPGDMNPALAGIVLEIRARLLQLAGGLDFLGLPTDIIPIWSFAYLQNVARYFAQQAVQAERDFINFQDRGENEALTRQQLEQGVTLAKAERELALQQREAAELEAAAYNEGQTLATTRAVNTQSNRDDYSTMTAARIERERVIAWYSAQNPWELEKVIVGEGPDVGRHVHEVIAELTQARGNVTRDYELAAMDRQIAELKQAQVMAQAQLNAAKARVEAAKQLEVVADLRTRAAADNLTAFDAQFFTPDVWLKMGQFMRNISRSYLHMALRVARLMQRAYNFENDLSRRYIRADYSMNAVKGLLAANALLLDIDSFTYDVITTVHRKEIPVKQTVSLAERYPFLLETELRRTGKMVFETRLDDFDLAYPGTFGQRLQSIEVEVEGILPSAGLRGILTNSGISRYRTPDNKIKFRVQTRETLVLSEYRIREDAIVFPADPSRLGVFEGAGTAGSWELEIPRASNDLDYRTITDVRLTFHYLARYDSALAATIKAQIASFAGTNTRARNIPMRWAFPDLFFNFQSTGRLPFTLTPLNFPYNEMNPKIRRLALIVMAEPGVDPSVWKIRLAVPDHPDTIAAQPSAQGEIVAESGHAWEPLLGGAALGDYRVEVRADENPSLVADGKLQLGKIRNIVLILDYEFTPRV